MALAKYPNCFLIGAMKAGTTAVADALSRHHQILIPDLKEPQLFTDQAFFNDTKISPQKYFQLYEHTVHTSIDASTWYLYDPQSAQMIHDYNPDAKIIAILRNPVERAFSHWQYLSRDGQCLHTTFADAVIEEMDMIAKGNWIHPYPYLAMGFYAKHLRRYYNLFPTDQIRIYLYDELKSNPQHVLDDILSFLEVDIVNLHIASDVNRSGIPSSKALHNFLNKPNSLRQTLKKLLPSPVLRKNLIKLFNRTNLRRTSLDLELAKELKTYFADDIVELEKILSISLSAWRAN